MKKKLTIILLSMVVAVTMLAPLQAFAQDTAAVAGQQSEQADSQEETSAPAQTQETAQKYTVKFRAADARGHLLKGAAFRVSAQNGGDRPKTPQPGTITNIGIAYIAFADIHSLLKEFF
jgi:Ni/Co efflux regulator RcnB